MSLIRTLTLVVLISLNFESLAQTGMSISPSRLYFQPGEKTEQVVVVRNPNKERELEVGISFNDWEYDSLGNNVTYESGELRTSLKDNIQIASGSSFFTLGPGESTVVRLAIKDVPKDNVPVRTAMMYLTQLNPGDGGTNTQGAAIMVSVRMGIKIYYTHIVSPSPDIEINSFAVEREEGYPVSLKLGFDNIGNGWLDGRIHIELLNQDTGDKYSLEETEFYSMPNDKRVFIQTLPEGMRNGNYTATALIKLSKGSVVKIAELSFKN